MNQKKITWGILGCGDVAEVKSGPAFQKVKHSQLLAVSRRDISKAKDFAERHSVPIFYEKAEDLLNNPKINAVYIATPPSSHFKYTLNAIEAKKNVYLEKPMTMTAAEAQEICYALKHSNLKLTVAHYRRQLPAFIKVEQLLNHKAIGNVIFANIEILQPERTTLIASSEKNWRTDPSVSGGGYFHDLAPHQLDLIFKWFGNPNKVSGTNNGRCFKNNVPKTVNGIIDFKNGIQFQGMWSFNVNQNDAKDTCTIYGAKGHIKFSFFGNKVELVADNEMRTFKFENPDHVQQPMIEKVVNYFRGNAENPCSAEEGLEVMKAMDIFSK